MRQGFAFFWQGFTQSDMLLLLRSRRNNLE
jgi:hypothetical protein